MDILSDKFAQWCDAIMSNTWAWFNSLNRDEWVVVLAVAAACGFLCMRGFGSRTNY